MIVCFIATVQDRKHARQTQPVTYPQLLWSPNGWATVVTRTVTAPREISPINRTRPRGGSQLRSNHRTVRDCRHLRESFQPAHRLPGRRAV